MEDSRRTHILSNGIRHVISYRINESFAQNLGQILLVDLIPPTNKVLSLVSQEEKHRNISCHTSSGTIDPVNNMAFAVGTDGVRKTGSDAP